MKAQRQPTRKPRKTTLTQSPTNSKFSQIATPSQLIWTLSLILAAPLMVGQY
jgi:hypothetical protein